MTDKDDKDEAMDRVERNADNSWKKAAEASVLALAKQQNFITSADVSRYLRYEYPDVTTHTLKALGPVMKNAARDGWIEKHSFGVHPYRHQTPCQVWRSLVRD